jgi:hypothetical protein
MNHPRDKAFKIPGDQIRRLIPNMGGGFASDRITVDGAPVGYMYREPPDQDGDWPFTNFCSAMTSPQRSP